MQQAFSHMKIGFSTFGKMDANVQRIFKIMRACHEPFTLYNVNLEEKKVSVQETLNCFLSATNNKISLSQLMMWPPNCMVNLNNFVFFSSTQ